MASREELLGSIQPGMRLDRAFFLKVYGYEISYPRFKDKAIRALQDAGCCKAEEYYNMTVSEHEERYDAELKEVAHWYAEECAKKWEKRQKEGEEQRNQKGSIQGKQWGLLKSLLNYQ